MNKQVVEGLRKGTAVLAKLNEQMRVEDVDKLMGETADAIAYQKV